MVRDWQRRLTYLLFAVAVVALGLSSRRYGDFLPSFVAEYAGDTLWALMVFLGLSVLWPNARVSYRGGCAIGIAYAVEVSQLYHAPWLDALRGTTLGGLVLGFGFVWTDLICYPTGVAIGVLMERILSFRRGTSDVV